MAMNPTDTMKPRSQFCIHAGTDELTSPVHQHRKGQLILALHGAITCTVENALWMVPPQYAVWIPGGVKS